MPELPEAETIRCQLEREVVGATVRRAEVYVPRAVREHASPAELSRLVEGRRVARVGRRGKALLLYLDGERPSTLIIRLGMTGLVRVVAGQEPLEKHAAVVLSLTDGRQMRFVDQRQFGSATARPGHGVENLPEFRNYGPEPLSEAFTPEYLKQALSRRSAAVESVLMSQNVVAGIGKIYADEILFRAGIRPTRAARRVTGSQCQRLWEAAREVLQEAIRCRGSSASDETFADVYGRPGEFQERLCVYQRTGQPCRVCGTPIKRVAMAGGRGMHYCPTCQK